MLRFIVSFLVVMFINSLAYSVDTLTLIPSSTITLRDEITEHSVSRIIMALALNKSNPVYLYLNSPGGDVQSGLSLMNVIKAEIATGKEVICIADYAASMAFSILQVCSKRLILEGGMVMQHQLATTITGKLLSIRERVKLSEALSILLNKSDASRIGMTTEDFSEKVANDWWLLGMDAVRYKVADSTVIVKCSESLVKTIYYDKITAPLGTITLKWSACPLIYEPESVETKPAFGVTLVEFNKWLDSISKLAKWKEDKSWK